MLVSCALLLTQPLYAQLGMGGKPHASAALDVQSTNKAFYPPRLTTTQRNAIADPQPGALVFDTDKGGLYLYDGTNWMLLAFTTPENQLSNQVLSPGILDNFGFSIAIDGNYAVIGASGDDIGMGDDLGTAYIFIRSGSNWSQQATLFAGDATAQDYFGSSVAISGNTVVIGAPGDDSDKGSAYVFVRTNASWSQQTKLTVSAGLANHRFGTSVGISGNYAIVGAPGENKAYIFERVGTNWTAETPFSKPAGSSFGNAVAISGTYAIVGANTSSVGIYAQQGLAYIFERSASTAIWSQTTTLTANDGDHSDYFGSSVAISSSYAVVGASRDEGNNGPSDGSVYVFFKSGAGWSQEARLILPAGEGNGWDYFGSTVAISGQYIIVGAPSDGGGQGIGPGGAYIFFRSSTGWILKRKLIDNFPAYGVGLSGSNFMVGKSGKATFGSIDN